MLTPAIRSKVDALWDKFWSGGIANPLTAIEQISYLLFMRRLDAMDRKTQEDAEWLGEALHVRCSPEARDELRWSQLPPPPRRGDARPRARPRLPVHQVARGRDSAVRSSDAGRRVHHPQGLPARRGGGDHRRDLRRDRARAAGQRPDVPRHPGRPVRVPPLGDRHRRQERPVPHPAPHHPDDLRARRPEARRGGLRPRLRHRRLPARRLPAHPHPAHQPRAAPHRRERPRARRDRRPAHRRAAVARPQGAHLHRFRLRHDDGAHRPR